MDLNKYKSILVDIAPLIESIRRRAYMTHAAVNQFYGVKGEPYSVHLEAVATWTMNMLPYVCSDENEVVAVIFGAFFHDSMEDARMTYNDVMKVSREYMPEDMAFLATEIVYALTNDKGRTRSERAGEKYYQGIRETAYAPLVKFCDRLANTSYSVNDDSDLNKRMLGIYRNEYPHFLEAITVQTTDLRLTIPEVALNKMDELLSH